MWVVVVGVKVFGWVVEEEEWARSYGMVGVGSKGGVGCFSKRDSLCIISVIIVCWVEMDFWIPSQTEKF